jgi:hypothetical protein
MILAKLGTDISYALSVRPRPLRCEVKMYTVARHLTQRAGMCLRRHGHVCALRSGILSAWDARRKLMNGFVVQGPHGQSARVNAVCF